MDLLCSSVSLISAIFAFLAWSRAGECSLVLEALKKVYKKLKEMENKDECLNKKAVVAIVEAARLLSEDAKELYERTGDEKFLEIAKKWEEFVKANRKAVEKALGYPSK